MPATIIAAALATCALAMLDWSTLFRHATSATRQLAALTYGAHGLLALVYVIGNGSTCEKAALAAEQASFILGRIALILHLGYLLHGPVVARLVPQALLTCIAFFSFGLQTAVVGRLADLANHTLMVAFVTDLMFLGFAAVWLIFCLALSFRETSGPPLSPTKYSMAMASEPLRVVVRNCCLLMATVSWFVATTLSMLQAIHDRDFSYLIAPSKFRALCLAATVMQLLGLLCLHLADHTSDASSDGMVQRRTWRKSRSPVWPSESAQKTADLEIQPFEHPYANSVTSISPTLSEELLKSIHDDFDDTRAVRSPTILVHSPEEVENNLIDLGTPPSPDYLSPTSLVSISLSSAATTGRLGGTRLSLGSDSSFPITPDMQDNDFTVPAPSQPSAHRSPPLSSPPASPLPSIPEEEPDTDEMPFFAAIPVRPVPAETKRVSTIYHHPTQSISSQEVTALGISV